MFTGIIEATGVVKKIEQEGSNFHFHIQSPISDQLRVDQSLAHDGVCLTVVAVSGDTHVVTAIEETMQRSNLGALRAGSLINLERAMAANGRLDGHIVQGHVDTTGVCTKVEERDGSWYYHFSYELRPEHLLVDKGSICINGVSLTVVSPQDDQFSVAIIPYTYENTNFKTIRMGDKVNLEFDILGKYIARYAQYYAKAGISA